MIYSVFTRYRRDRLGGFCCWDTPCCLPSRKLWSHTIHDCLDQAVIVKVAIETLEPFAFSSVFLLGKRPHGLNAYRKRRGSERKKKGTLACCRHVRTCHVVQDELDVDRRVSSCLLNTPGSVNEGLVPHHSQLLVWAYPRSYLSEDLLHVLSVE